MKIIDYIKKLKPLTSIPDYLKRQPVDISKKKDIVPVMKSATIIRGKSTDEGTKGILTTNGFTCCVLELPWRDNKSNISCIPEGIYSVKIYKSLKYGTIYLLHNTEPRTYILTHWGNFAGDVDKGFLSHSAGCILLGQSFGTINNQDAVLNSRTTVRRFMKAMNNEEFTLEIRGS